MLTGSRTNLNKQPCHSAICSCTSCQLQKKNPTLLEEIIHELELPEKFRGKKLITPEKDALRAQARRGREKIVRWKKICAQLQAQGKDCHIHHIVPLQYIHLFKGKNPNSTSNVLLLSEQQHQRIHAELRKRLKNAKTNEERKKILDDFRAYVLKANYYKSGKVPPGYGNTILKEILQEFNL